MKYYYSQIAKISGYALGKNLTSMLNNERQYLSDQYKILAAYLEKFMRILGITYEYEKKST